MDYLFNTDKLKYVKGDKPDVDCILCSIVENDPKVPALEVYRTELSLICLNLYPFNAGHLMVLPMRHVESYEDLSKEEGMDIFNLTQISIEILNDLFKPAGYNVGFNVGMGSGASIPHIHQHIVPRYNNEVGFLDVIGGAKILVVDPKDVLTMLSEKFSKIGS